MADTPFLTTDRTGAQVALPTAKLVADGVEQVRALLASPPTPSLPNGAATQATLEAIRVLAAGTLTVANPGGNTALAAILAQLQATLSFKPVAAMLPNVTKRGGTITTGGTVQQVAASNPNRTGMTFQNTSDTAMWVSEDGTDAAVGNGYYLQPIINMAAGGACNISSQQKVTVFCATTGKTFASSEY